MQITITTLCLFASTILSAQIKNTSELLQKSQHYYDSLQTFSCSVHEKHHLASEEKTRAYTFDCFVDKAQKIQLINTKFRQGMMLKAGSEYILDYNDSTFGRVKDKEQEWFYVSVFSKYPFFNFEFIKKELSASQFPLTELDSIYQVTGPNSIYEFRKSDASVSRIYKSGVDSATKFETYDEIVFDRIQNNSEVAARITEAATIIKSKQKKSLSEFKSSHFDIAIFNDPRISWLNEKPASFTGKRIVLDFFFQGCYPCVMSYPGLIDLYRTRDSNTLVIGIDTPAKDSTTAEAYLKKYNIIYPVITGEMAKKISDELVIGGWPTLMLIDEKGKILKREEGYSKNQAKRMKQYVHWLSTKR